MNLHVSDQAARDLVSAADAVSDWSISSAERLIDEWDAALDRLQQFPGIGHRHAFLRGDVFVINVGSYLLVYRLTSDSLEVVRLVRADAIAVRLDFEAG